MGSTFLNEFEIQPNTKHAIILGNEVDGVADEVIEIVDYCIEIPQFGTKHSLNVSIAAGIVMWDFFRILQH